MQPGVFHPGFFYSTRFLYEHLSSLELAGKKLLELGCGSGLLSIMAARKGAIVTASDISLTACRTLHENTNRNNAGIEIIHSDLYAGFSPRQFDFIVVNPPYYKGEPAKEADHAWYCGNDHEYFRRLFGESPAYMHKNSKMIMVLSSDCELGKIASLCTGSGLGFTLKEKKKFFFETEFIYHVTR